MPWTLVTPAVTAAAPSQLADCVLPQIDATGADLLVLVMSSYPNGGDNTTVTDTSSNSWTQAGSQAGSDAFEYTTIFYKIAPSSTGISALTVTALNSTGPTNMAAVLYAFTQGSSTTYQNNFTGSSVTGTTLQPGSVGSANDLVITGTAWYATAGYTINSSFSTVTETVYTAAQNIGISAAWKQVSGAVNPIWTAAGSNHMSAAIASFTGTSSGTAYTLDGGPGSYTVTGGDIDAVKVMHLNGAAGSYTYTGADATFALGAHILVADAGSYTVTGAAATLLANGQIQMDAEPGAYSIEGVNFSNQFDYNFNSAGGAYTLTGANTGSTSVTNMNAAAGSYLITGRQAALIGPDDEGSTVQGAIVPQLRLRRSVLPM